MTEQPTEQTTGEQAVAETATRRTSPRRTRQDTTLDGMSAYVTGFNTTTSPLSIDRAGRVLGGGEYGAVRLDQSPVSGHVAAGRIVAVERPSDAAEDTLNPEAVQAFAQTDQANSEGAS